MSPNETICTYRPIRCPSIKMLLKVESQRQPRKQVSRPEALLMTHLITRLIMDMFDRPFCIESIGPPN